MDAFQGEECNGGNMHGGIPDAEMPSGVETREQELGEHAGGVACQLSHHGTRDLCGQGELPRAKSILAGAKVVWILAPIALTCAPRKVHTTPDSSSSRA
eukprot:14124225-Alexandrium_andersonii.AAC.1